MSVSVRAGLDPPSINEWRPRVPAESAPCALCVRGNLDVTDQATVDARADRRCGGKGGAWSSGEVAVASSTKIWGADGNDTPNEPGDYLQAQPADAALAWIFTDADLVALKRLARSRGTYYRGSVVFDPFMGSGTTVGETTTAPALLEAGRAMGSRTRKDRLPVRAHPRSGGWFRWGAGSRGRTAVVEGGPLSVVQ